MTEKYSINIKRFPASVIFTEMKITTMSRYYFIPIRTSIIRRKESKNEGERERERENIRKEIVKKKSKKQ